MTIPAARTSQPYGGGIYPNIYNDVPHNPFAGAVAPPMSPQATASAPGWEDCSICLENCGDHPEGDRTKAKVIAKTDCNHYFHNFCLQKHLNSGVNKDCPLCRNHLADRNITKMNLDPANPATDVRILPVEDNGVTAGSVAYGLLSGLGKASWMAGSLLVGVGVGATKIVGGALLNAASDFVWPKEIDPESVKIINREVDRIHNEITKKIQGQQEAMRLLLAQVASVGQDRSKNPVAILEQVKTLQAKVAKNAEVYLRQTDALVKDMQRVSNGF